MVLLFLFCSIYPPTLLLTIEHSFSNFDLRREEILIQAYLVFLVTEHRVVARLYQVKYYYLLKCFPVTHKRGVRCPLLLLRFITCQPVMTVTGSQVRHSNGSGSAFPVSTVLNGEESAPVCEHGRWARCLINMDSWRF